MRRSPSILLTLTAVGVLGAFGPAPAGAQKASGVTVKQDGDFVVLTPTDPSKVVLVFGCPRFQERSANSCPPGRLTYLTGEQRFPAKEFDRLTILEVERITEMALLLEGGGLQVKELPVPPPPKPGAPLPDKPLASEPCFCDKPLPPPPPH